ncbi:putative ribonuclease H-like domain-containing protein, partial [Tanacetum coccineum]
GKPQQDDTGFVDSGCSRHMTGNIAYLSDFKEFDGGYVTFRGGAHGGRISGKGTLKTDSLDFEDVYFVNELKFNLFSVSQMCDKKNYVLFTDTECLVLSPNFKLPDESQILLKIPRKDNMYSFDMKNIVPKETLTCLVAKATSDESMLWHRRLGHINFKNINKLVKDNLGSNTELLDETYEILKNFIKEIENLVDKKVKIIRSDNGTELWMIFAKKKGPPPKVDGKSDEGFFVGYSLSSKAFRVYNTRTRRVEENLHIGFLENKPMIEGNGPKWLFDIDSLTQSMNYVPVTAEKSMMHSNPKEDNAAGQHINTTSLDVNTSSFKLNDVGPSVNTASSYNQNSPKDMFTMGASHTLEATHVEFFSDEDEPGVDLGNITNSYTVPTTPNTRIHKDHPIKNVIGDVNSTIQTRRMTKPTSEQGQNPQVLLKLYLIHLGWKQYRKNFCNLNFNRVGYLWICLLERGLLEQNRQEKGIDYEEVFAPVAKIKSIRLFLAYASFMGFMVYQMDVKSAFLYGTIEEEVYVTQPPGFKDPDHLDKVYKVVKALYGVTSSSKSMV